MALGWQEGLAVRVRACASLCALCAFVCVLEWDVMTLFCRRHRGLGWSDYSLKKLA